MSRTKRHVPHWATPEQLAKLVEYVRPKIIPERAAFYHGYDKMGRKSSILNPDDREEVWGEKNKRYLRTKLSRKVRRYGKKLIQEQLEEDQEYWEELIKELDSYFEESGYMYLHI